MPRISLRVLSVLTLGAASPLAAQTFPTDDPVIKRIYSIGMDSSHLQTEAHVLFDSLGPRLMDAKPDPAVSASSAKSLFPGKACPAPKSSRAPGAYGLRAARESNLALSSGTR